MDDRSPHADRLRRLAAHLEAGVDQGRAEQLAARALARAGAEPVGGTLRRRLAAATAGATLLAALFFGTGVLADSAVPGDLLYPIDRAYELIGFGDDAVEERLERRLAVVEQRVWMMGAAGVTAGVGGSAIMNMLGM